MIVNQWVPAAHAGDAIGGSARRMRDLLRGMGHDGELYALTIDEGLQGDVRPFGDSAAHRGGAEVALAVVVTGWVRLMQLEVHRPAFAIAVAVLRISRRLSAARVRPLLPLTTVAATD